VVITAPVSVEKAKRKSRVLPLVYWNSWQKSSTQN